MVLYNDIETIKIWFHRTEFSQISLTNRQKKALNTDFDKISPPNHDLRRHQTTLNDLVTPETTVKRTSNKRNKNVLKARSVHGVIQLPIKI